MTGRERIETTNSDETDEIQEVKKTLSPFETVAHLDKQADRRSWPEAIADGARYLFVFIAIAGFVFAFAFGVSDLIGARRNLNFSIPFVGAIVLNGIVVGAMFVAEKTPKLEEAFKEGAFGLGCIVFGSLATAYGLYDLLGHVVAPLGLPSLLVGPPLILAGLAAIGRALGGTTEND